MCASEFLALWQQMARDLELTRKQQSPRSLTWGLSTERMTGIEPAL